MTVAVCTLNRARLLEGCLDALDRQALAEPFEIMVVDNGSTDDTADVVRSHPAARHVIEPVLGLSHARNTALRSASAELVAFVDDDARPEPTWAAAMLAARRRWPEAGAIGGLVTLGWPGPRPRWLVRGLERWYSTVDLGPEARLIEANEQLVGANLAVARDAALAVGGFSVDLGRVGASLGSEEEVELLTRLHRRSVVGWEPSAAVLHMVGPERLTRRWLLRRAWAQGRSDAVRARLAGAPLIATPNWRGVARAVTRGWPTAAREILDAEVRSGALMRELVRRSRALGRARAGA